MQASDVLTRPARQPDLALSYGPFPDHVADLWLPRADAGDTVATVVFLHGGFWRAAYDRRHTGPLAEALAADGFVVCCPEYRRVGQPGGSWPGTMDDVRRAVSSLPGLIATAAGAPDGRPLVLAGHSAGGHLALWASGLAERADAVVSLAGVCDLADAYRRNLGSGATAEFMGGGPEEFPERYAEADPGAVLPSGLRVSLVHGTADDRVPWEQSRDYRERAQAAGDQVRCVLLPGTGHFELIDPLSAAWPAVLAEFRRAAYGPEQVP